MSQTPVYTDIDFYFILGGQQEGGPLWGAGGERHHGGAGLHKEARQH